MKAILFISLITLSSIYAAAQRPTNVAVRNSVDSINRLIDQCVVNKNFVILQKHYADDFVFTHGTGLVDTKKSWLKTIADTSVRYNAREHDSTVVELHGDIAIVSGKLTVRIKANPTETIYALRYVRVFNRRQKIWQMISHRTTAEWHLN